MSRAGPLKFSCFHKFGETAKNFSGRLMKFGFIATSDKGWPTFQIKCSKLAGPVYEGTKMLKIGRPDPPCVFCRETVQNVQARG